MLAIEMLAGKNGMEKAEALASRMPLVHYHTSCLAWADGGRGRSGRGGGPVRRTNDK